ncbi:hypothetical protein J2Z21_000614 [Streptomyces griseochromogenes]|uniref:Uncharacterized protein n=1 Tax=Streptomyces griseochromogenes TaxID=68214 RepID=A0ABS4LJY3_9ACTN|nr:hypothetical protein [Streptomyces griseochromogenes]
MRSGPHGHRTRWSSAIGKIARPPRNCGTAPHKAHGPQAARAWCAEDAVRTPLAYVTRVRARQGPTHFNVGEGITQAGPPPGGNVTRNPPSSVAR